MGSSCFNVDRVSAGEDVSSGGGRCGHLHNGNASYDTELYTYMWLNGKLYVVYMLPQFKK